MDIRDLVHERIANNDGSEYVKEIIKAHETAKVSEVMTYLLNKEGINNDNN